MVIIEIEIHIKYEICSAKSIGRNEVRVYEKHIHITYFDYCIELNEIRNCYLFSNGNLFIVHCLVLFA